MASAVIGALRVTLGIDTAAFTQGISNAQKQMGAIGAKMTSVGKGMTAGITAPLVAFGGLALKVAGDFEASMNKVAAVSGATGDELAAMRDQAKLLGATTQFSASQAADAMGFLAMAGFKANEVIAAMPGTLQLAASAQMDLGTTADIVSNILSGYGLKVEELGRVNDVLVKAFTASNTNLEQLGEAMKYAGPVASAAGVGFEEAAAALGMMGNAGIQASMAGTSLRGAISRILAPTKSMRGAMAEAGLAFTDAQGKLLPLADIVENLAPHAEDAGLFMELFGQRAGPAMAALVSQGSGALRDLTTELLNSGGTAERIADVQMEGFNGAMRELTSAFEGLQIAIAESGLIEWATEAVNAIAAWVQEVSKTSPELLKWGTIVAGLAVVVGPVVLALGLFATAIAAVSIPVAAVIAALGAMGVALYAFWPEIVTAKDKVVEFATMVGETIAGLPQFFIDAKDGALLAVQQLVEGVSDWFGSKLDDAVAKVSAVGAKIAAPFKAAWDAVVGNSYIPDLVRGVEEWLSRLARTAPEIAGRAADGVAAPFAGIGDTISDASGSIEDMKGTARSFFGDLRSGLDQGKSAWEAFSDAATRAIDRITDKLMNEMLDALFQVNGAATGGGKGGGIFGGLLNAVGGAIGGMFGGGSSGLSFGAGNTTGAGGAGFSYTSYGGPRAAGGPVMPNRAYMVGEMGREMFVPNTAGTIIPNDALGGGGGTNLTVHVHGARGNAEIHEMARAGAAEAIAAAAPGIVKQSTAATRDQFTRQRLIPVR
jgi:TP901 family phage tail tape measure protein